LALFILLFLAINMVGMKSWVKAERGRASFAQLFGEIFEVPVDRSSSRSIKTLSDQEMHSSGPSLRALETLEVNQLKLGEDLDHSWAMGELAAYGPCGFDGSWQSDFMVLNMPTEIRDESHVGKYVEGIHLQRALCGGFFLFSLATGLQPQTCPTSSNCLITNQSSSGPSGRPDAQLELYSNICTTLEYKTKRVCICSGKDVLDELRHVNLLYGDQGFIADLLESSSAAKKKAIKITYQVFWFSSEIIL
jgi:hypothetical protein